jgi:hypothetical protein
VNSPSQPSDRLRDILHRARERSATAASAAVPAAQQRAQGQATVESLLDKSQPLPDPRALSRLYRDQALEQLPEESDDAAAAPAQPLAPTATTDWQNTPAPAPAAEPVLTQPILSPAEIRAVMNSLQEKFSTSSYRLFEVPKGPVDDFAESSRREQEERERAELEQLAVEAKQSNLVSIMGALLVILVIGAFIWLATSGPLKAKPAPSVTPSASAKP